MPVVIITQVQQLIVVVYCITAELIVTPTLESYHFQALWAHILDAVTPPLQLAS